MEGRLGAAHVSARAVRAVSLLTRFIARETRVVDKQIVDAIDDLVELIELANDGRVKVRFEWHGLDDSDDSEDFVDDEAQ